MPSRKESAFYRRKNDERVELMGTPCKLYRAKDGATRTVDEFDEIMITKAGYEPIPIDSFVIMESYQEERSRVGKGQATEYKDLPLTATFRFADDVRRLDLVEVPYEYAIAAGLIRCLDDSAVRPPTKTLYTRFKITNRMTRGINSDLTNKYYVVPSEEVWAV